MHYSFNRHQSIRRYDTNFGIPVTPIEKDYTKKVLLNIICQAIGKGLVLARKRNVPYRFSMEH